MNAQILTVWMSIIVSISASGINSESPILKINNGYIRGVVNKTVGLRRQYYAFRGIPFAEPPVGLLRFEPPLPKRDWDGILNATEDKSPCVQGLYPAISGSEDCLFVNVYTPTLERRKKLAVMVWVYGGIYLFGTSSFKDYGPDYFLDKEVIIVTFNYRLGIIGFLSTGDELVPGNNAMKDHIQALKWVQENIEYFGGDPKRVTVFGGSAGAVSVSYLLLSPLAKGLFSRAIMQSGVSLCRWAISRSVTKTAFDLAEKLGLEANDTKTLVHSLKYVNATYLYSESMRVTDNRMMDKEGLLYGPVIEPHDENAFLTASSYELLLSGKFIDVPTIIGFTSMEMNIPINDAMKAFFYLHYDLAVKNLAPNDMNIRDNQQANLVGKKIKQHYFGSNSVSSSEHQYRIYLSHDAIVRPTRQFVKQLSKKSNVFFYRFAYVGGMAGIPFRPSPGAIHSEEINYMWRNHSPATSELDLLTRERVLTMWTNFAKYADPTPKKDPVLNDIIWLPSRSLGENRFVFLNINKTLSVGIDPEGEDMEFWDDLYDEYAVPPLETY